MTKLYLVQHGEAVSKDVDPGRPLSPVGEEDVKKISEFLQNSGASVDRILHSGKMRAHQTAEILAEKLLHEGEVEAITGINPNDPVTDFSPKIRKLQHDVMLVGHLPFMAKLASYLVTGQEEPVIVAFKPGSVVCLEQNEAGDWQVQWMIRPDSISKQ